MRGPEYNLIAGRPTDMMRTVDYPSKHQWSRPSGPRVAILLSWLRAAILFLTPVLLLQGSALAETERKSVPDLTLALESNRVQLWAHVIPGERPVYADFDGDHKRDVARGLLVGDHYEVVVSLSTRADVIILQSPIQLAGFTIHALDINHDRNPDVVAISPTEPYPLAVWLGDGQGNFRSADRKSFGPHSGLTRSPEYQTGRFQPAPDSWTEPLYPVSEAPLAGHPVLPPGADDAIASAPAFFRARQEYFRTAPRSPPSKTAR